jgi:hypothetical protein
MEQKRKSNTSDISEVTRLLRSIAIDSLGRMYCPSEYLFAFRLKKTDSGEVLEGHSSRYTAIALIGLVGEDRHVVSDILAKHNPLDICGRLIAGCEKSQELGEVALTAWAARVLRHKDTHKAVTILKSMKPETGIYPTVELSWALTALVVNGAEPAEMTLVGKIADILINSFRIQSALFPHSSFCTGLPVLRDHINCFADFVYPVMALSYYYKVTADKRAAEIACRSAEEMCKLQGQDGQWWWHYDVRTGQVVERYPVYSVHQDAMAPMALFALADACGVDYSHAIKKGLDWLTNPPEIAGSLIDTQRKIIWRKVARREPAKLVRKLQAVASSLHPAMRVPAGDLMFPPVAIDYETRPYEMGWLLHTWPCVRTVGS